MAHLVDINREQLQERVAPSVDEYFIHCHWNSQRTLVSFIPPAAITFLDLGCGPNADILSLLPDLDYTGVDFVPEYITALRKKYPEAGTFHFSRRRFVTAAMESLPFPGESYDVVYSRHTLEHVSDLKRTLVEIQRVLKPGGRFIFCMPSDPNDTEPAHLTRWRAHRWLHEISSIVNIKFFGQHDYFINEIYGYGIKPGGLTQPVVMRVYHLLRRLYNFRWYSLGWLYRRGL